MNSGSRSVPHPPMAEPDDLPERPRPRALIRWLAVGVGGALGGLARYLLTVAIPESRDGLPWTTLVINVVGAFALGALSAVLAEHPDAPRWLRPLIGTGLLGGFTTFSAYALAIDDRFGLLGGSADPGLAWLGLALALLVGPLAAALGLMTVPAVRFHRQGGRR